MDISRIVEIPQDDKFECHFCGKSFQGKDDLMLHRKKDHQSKVSLCRNFPKGNCPMADKCWFVHAECGNTFATDEHECNICDTTFDNKSEYMKHRKLKHETNVTPCIHAMTSKCIFGKEKCWFLHDKQEVLVEAEKTEKIIQYNQDVFDKLFNMMEKITERIVLMENVL